MKKVISKVVALMAILGMVSCTAMAAGPITAEKKDGVVTVKVSDLQKGEETSLLVTKGEASIDEAFADTTKVYHIDQVAAAEDGVSTFTFNYATTDAITIYSGHALMGADESPYFTSIKDESVTPDPGPGEEPDPDDPEEPKYDLGDVNADGVKNVTDVNSVVSFITSGDEFTTTDENGEQVSYEYGWDAANVNCDEVVNVTDLTSIIDYIITGKPFAAE